MQNLNLIRVFELQRMKESETIKEYSDRLLGIVNRVKLLGTSFTYSRIVEKILVTVLETYKASITTLKNTKDLSKITLAELLNALQVQEKRRLMRQDHVIEGVLQAKYPDSNKKKFFRKKIKLQAAVRLLPVNFITKKNFLREIFHHVSTATRWVIHHSSAGRDLMQGVANITNLDMKQLSVGQNLRKKKMLKSLVKMIKIRCL